MLTNMYCLFLSLLFAVVVVTCELNAGQPTLPIRVKYSWVSAGAKIDWMFQGIYGRDVSGTKDAGKILAFSCRKDTWAAIVSQHLATPQQEFGLHFQYVIEAQLDSLAQYKNLSGVDLSGIVYDHPGIVASGLDISDKALRSIGSLKRLKYLNLSRTQITDGGLREVAKLTNLQCLRLGRTKVTDVGIKELAGLKYLSVLNLESTRMMGFGLKQFTSSKSLGSSD